ncbi:hypothetical protein FALBO_14153 [Fusarium albosuccineum]|uniref:Uncharacterized protein n=1 Tax=Fusarium albosuccineum TaxID=1237068 RepID=A0A8H4P6F4_9HYPO|nr:hypothetical protein FALBO_14153 [Fusarium albosuccineum]
MESETNLDMTLQVSESSPSSNTGFLSLPSEIILWIQEEYLPWEDTRSLILTCSRFFQLCKPYFYRGGGFVAFRRAVSLADLEFMQRCASYNAAPVVTWRTEYGEYSLRVDAGLPVPAASPECGCGDMCAQHPHIKHRPVDLLMISLERDQISAAQCLEALQWLANKGFDLYHAFHHHRQEGPKPSQTKLAGLARIIRFLSREGLTIYKVLETGKRLVPREENYTLYVPMSSTTKQVMELMMRSSCPPYILERFAMQMFRGGLPLNSDMGIAAPPIELYGFQWKRGVYNWVMATRMRTWLNTFYDDLFDPQAWKPAYASHSTRKGFLEAILAGIRGIEARERACGALFAEIDGLQCWYELCMSVHEFVKSRQLPERNSPLRMPRLHEFQTGLHWDPQLAWFNARQKMAEARFEKWGTPIPEEYEQIETPTDAPNDSERPKWYEMPMDKWHRRIWPREEL